MKWSDALIYIIAAKYAPRVVGWICRLAGWVMACVGLGGGTTAERGNPVTTLRYPRQYQGLMLVGGLMVAASGLILFGVGIARLIHPPVYPSAASQIVGIIVLCGLECILLPMGLLGCYSLLAGLRYKVAISETGITQYGPVRLRPLTVRWAEINQITYEGKSNWRMKGYRIQSAKGTIVIDQELEEVERFVWACHRYLGNKFHIPRITTPYLS